MDQDISADFARLLYTRDNIGSGSRQIQGILDEMQGQLLQVQWTGESADAYYASQKKWSEGMSGLQGVLAAVGNAVQEAIDRYQENEGRGAGIFN